MHFEGQFDVGAPRDRVWAFVTDPQKVGRCGPEVQSVEVVDPAHFKVVARAGIGPIRTTFALDVEFTETRPSEHAAVHTRGQAPGSAVEMTSTLDLADAAAGRTTLRWTSDVIVSGKIASIGARLVQSAADKITQQVFACMKQELEGPSRQAR
jgi:carbon monoxide dehydrogenase subunit G